MTDKDGNLVCFGNYTGWGRLKEETRVTDSAYQTFRLQNQYADRETGLHYDFFRYYEPEPNAGRYVNQGKIMLWIKQQDGVKDMMIHKEQDMENIRI